MKTVIITGASRGIGLATAQKFLKEGWFVIGTSTTANAPLVHRNFINFKLDYLVPETILSATEEIAALSKKIDVLINNAGYGEDEPVETIDITLLRKTFEINVVGTADFTIHLLPILNSPSHIVNISSRSASLTNFDENSSHIPSYKISKVALNMFTKTLAHILKGKNIVVSSIDPGWVKTDMGGNDAPKEPTEAAEEIYGLAVSHVETGQFWQKGKRREW